MVSSVEVPPIITSSADTIDGGADLVNQYLNEDAMSPGQPSSSPIQSSRGLTPSSEGRQPSSTTASQTGGSHKENRNLDDSKGAGDALKNHRASRAGARSVSKLTPQQLARKRANDREAQRAIRQRTKEHIDNLEKELQELRSHGPVYQIEQRNRELEELVEILKDQLAQKEMKIAQLVGVGQGMTMGMGADAQNINDMNWPAMSQPYDAEGMATFNPQPIGVSQPGELTGPGNDLLQQYADVNQDLMTPYPSAASATGNFPEMNNSALNYGTLPGQNDLIGLPGDMATPTWTNSMSTSFPMGDPNMLSPPNRYLNPDDVSYPYDAKPPALQSQPSNPQPQLQPPSMQPRTDGPPNIKYELSPKPMPNQPQQVQTPQPMRQLTSSLPTPPEQEIERRRIQQQQQQQQQQRQQQQQQHQQRQQQHQQQQEPHSHQRPLQPNIRSNLQTDTQIPPRMQPKQQNHPHQQLQPASSLEHQAGGIPIAPAPPHPPPPAHLQRRQPSSQDIQPTSQEQQMQLQRQRKQQQQQQKMQQLQQRQLSPRISQQMPGNMTQQAAQLPHQPSITYWAQTPIFLPPTCTIDSLLHSALAQHRNSVRNGGTNHRAPDFSYLLSMSSSNGSCPLAPAQSDPSPLSSAISRAIHVAGFRGLPTQAAVLYTTHCLLRWQADPQPETYAHIPDWLRPGRMQLTMPHALWVSQLVWRPLREWVATQGGRYVMDEFIFCYARNLKLDWERNGGPSGGGRSLTGSSDTGRKGSREKAFESGVFELGAGGEVVMTGKFEQAVRELGNWGMRREFLANYPELGECVGRARDSFSS